MKRLRQTAVLSIINPLAARGTAATVWKQVEQHLPAHSTRLTQAPGDAERWALEWKRAEPEGVILVVGGDGTIHEVVNGLLAESDRATLGVIPAGTGNDFARNTGVPTDSRAAVERILGDTPVQVDVGRIHLTRADGGGDRRIFVNSASVGVSPRANRIAARFRALLPGRACYSLGGVVALLAESAGSYTVESGDGTPRPVRALNLTVANGACFGGGMRISPGSSPVDGILEQVTIGDIGRLAALRALSRLYAGTHIGMPGITVATLAGPLRITRSDGSMVVETDGENLEAVGAIAIEALPGALRLL